MENCYASWSTSKGLCRSKANPDLTGRPKEVTAVVVELFGRAMFRYLLVRGIREGYLAPYRVYRAMTRITKEGVSVDGREFGPQELERRVTVPDRNRKMAEEVERVAVRGKTLVYAKTKRHAAELARCFNALRPSLGGRYAKAITTDSADPQDAIGRFKREEFPRIAVSVGMLEGQ